MTRNTFSRRRFLQLSGGLALAGVSLPLWAHDMADMASGDAHPALRLPEPYKIKLAINKSAVCLAPVAVAEQQKIFSKYNLDVEFVNFGSSTDVLLGDGDRREAYRAFVDRQLDLVGLRQA